MSSITYGSRKIPKNYSESYDVDKDDVGITGSSDEKIETTFGYNTRETVQRDAEDMEEDISDSGKIIKNYSNIDKEREAIFEENTLKMVENHAETKGKGALKHGKMP